jgi:glycosyltransferase 2 family protein
MKPLFWIVLGIVVSALAVVGIARELNLEEFVLALSQARWGWVVLCALLLLLALFPRAWRWRVLLNGDAPYWRTFHMMNVGYLVNNLLPFRLGEVARMYLMTQVQPPIPPLRTLSTMVLERLLDLLAVVLLLAFALSSGPVPFELRLAGAGGGALVLVGFIVLVVMAAQRQRVLQLVDTLQTRLHFLQHLPLQKLIGSFLEGLQLLTNPRRLGFGMLLTALSWGISVFAGYILMFAFFTDANHLAVTCLYIASAAFVIAVPAVPGNVGTYEASIIFALSSFGYGNDVAVATAFAVVVHGVNLVTHLAAGVYGFVEEGISIQRLSQGVREMQRIEVEAK